MSLDPEMCAIDGIRAALGEQAEAIAFNWQGTIDHLDPECLHDLRVGVRRSRTILGQGKRVLSPSVTAHAREWFGWLGALTGPARDLDVHLIEWRDDTRPLGTDAIAALEPVRTLLERRCLIAHATLSGQLRSATAEVPMSAWQTWLAEPVADDSRGARSQRPLGVLVARRIERTQADLVDRGRLIDPGTAAEQLHDLRKDAKTLRYLLECFKTLLPDEARNDVVGRLKSLQDNLGEHQDAAVRFAVLRAAAHDLGAHARSADTDVAIMQLLDVVDRRRLRARAEFARCFAAYDTSATERTFRALLRPLQP